ncbi:DUF4062 domain-containing protein [candidate division KSB1 bacterium]|nr:DUF4062 domain-containing protein [candidate division KSB1 bacterium]
MPSLKIFLSSTYLDLKDYRQAAIEVVNRYQCVPLAMEFFGALPEEPAKVCDKEVTACDIFVGIYAHRFGFVPKGKKKSITQQEYELAKKLNKPCFCFIISPEHAWPPALIEFEQRAALNAFLDVVKKEKVVDHFKEVHDFASKLTSALGKWLAANTSNQQPASSNKRLIPLAPTPFIAHPYPLPQHFTGREAEKALLSNWLHNAPEPMLVLEAIGGMGKSALSWVWLQQEVLAKNAELDGVLWWSFYDEPFEAFSQSLFFYLTSKEVRVERGALTDQLSLLHSILYNNRFLLILDGFERALRGYSGMKAMFIQEPLPSTGSGQAARGPFDSAQGDNHTRRSHAERSRSITPDEERERRLREPVHPQAGQFLKRLATGKCKTLLTTRLFPAALEEVAGVRHERLAGLSPSDSVRFFRSQGLIGSRAEMERAAAIYGNHPLMLKLLSTALRRKRAKDMAAAFKLNLIDQKEPQKILTTSFNLLNKKEQQVAATIAVFRSSFDFAAAKALFPRTQTDRLWELLQGLQQLGFLFYDESHQQYDFHPILRSFLYDHLTARDAVHQRAVVYFQALPAPEKVMTLADLAPVIERYHHLIGAGKFDEAFELYRDRLNKPIYYQLANYNLEIELLRALFPEGEDHPPRLQKEADQAWTLNVLANSYALSGQPAQAVPLFLMHNTLREKSDDKNNLAIGLGNVAIQQYEIGQLSASAGHLRKRIALCQEIKEEFYEAIGHQEWGRVLAYQGRWQIRPQTKRAAAEETSTAESELARAFELFEKDNNVQSLSVVSTYRALAFLLQARLSFFQRGTKENTGQLAVQALQQVLRLGVVGLEFEGLFAITDSVSRFVFSEEIAFCDLVVQEGGAIFVFARVTDVFLQTLEQRRPIFRCVGKFFDGFFGFVEAGVELKGFLKELRGFLLTFGGLSFFEVLKNDVSKLKQQPRFFGVFGDNLEFCAQECGDLRPLFVVFVEFECVVKVIEIGIKVKGFAEKLSGFGESFGSFAFIKMLDKDLADLEHQARFVRGFGDFFEPRSQDCDHTLPIASAAVESKRLLHRPQILGVLQEGLMVGHRSVFLVVHVFFEDLGDIHKTLAFFAGVFGDLDLLAQDLDRGCKVPFKSGEFAPESEGVAFVGDQLQHFGDGLFGAFGVLLLVEPSVGRL